MSLFPFKKKKSVESEGNVITDEVAMTEEEADKTRLFDVEQQPVTEEKTAIFDTEKLIDEPTDETSEGDSQDLELLDEDEDYEYVTPQYGRKAIKLTLICVAIGMVFSFVMFQERIKTQIRENYQRNGYALTHIGATASANDIRKGKTAYVMGQLVEGEYVELDTTLATATANDILAGYTAYVNGTKITGTIPTYTGPTLITPGAKDFKINKGTYIPEGVIIAGEGNFVPKNIKASVKIFGVTGTYK